MITADAITGYHAPTWLCLFDQLNIAQCAAERAKGAAFLDQDRFKREYQTAKMWMAKEIRF